MAGKMIPLYGFVEGDTLGLLILGYENETIHRLIEKLQKSAELRVKIKERAALTYHGRVLDPSLTLKDAGIEALERVDLRYSETPGGLL